MSEQRMEAIPEEASKMNLHSSQSKVGGIGGGHQSSQRSNLMSLSQGNNLHGRGGMFD